MKKSPVLPPARDRTAAGTTQVSNELQKRFQKRQALQGEGERRGMMEGMVEGEMLCVMEWGL